MIDDLLISGNIFILWFEKLSFSIEIGEITKVTYSEGCLIVDLNVWVSCKTFQGFIVY